MPLLHNRVYEVLRTIRELERDLQDLRETIEASNRRTNRRAVFCAHMLVHFEKERIIDQIPEFYRENDVSAGRVVAVDYRTEKVTVDCGSVTGDFFGNGTVTVPLVFELDIQDVYVPREYESDCDGDFDNSDHGFNSDD